MGTLANSFFQTLVGWIRTLAAEIWTTASSPQTTTILSWIGRNWKPLAVLLCAVGLVVDLLVYLFRWQPFRVWRSFFRRLRNRRERVDEPDYTEDIPKAEEEDTQSFPENEGRFVPGQERTAVRTAPAAAGVQYSEPERLTWSRNEPEGTTPLFEEAIRPRRRRVSRLLNESGREDTVSPDQLIDQYAAYRKPVYPRRWKEDEGDGEDAE